MCRRRRRVFNMGPPFYIPFTESNLAVLERIEPAVRPLKDIHATCLSKEADTAELCRTLFVDLCCLNYRYFGVCLMLYLTLCERMIFNRDISRFLRKTINIFSSCLKVIK